MAVSPLGNIIFVNQNMNVAASVQNMQFNRYDIQQAAAQALVNEKERQIEETRPPEEAEAINPDREHEREKAQEWEQERKQATRLKPPKKEDEGFTVDEEGKPHIDIHV